jgi:hypothetical protein
VPIVMKSGSLNLLEPSGPVKACNEIALPFTPRKFPLTEMSTRNISWGQRQPVRTADNPATFMC